MTLFELVDKNRKAIRSAGIRAISRLKAKGVAVHYVDRSLAPGIIEESPDGRRRSLDTPSLDESPKMVATKAPRPRKSAVSALASPRGFKG